jgi:hypothetical protein
MRLIDRHVVTLLATSYRSGRAHPNLRRSRLDCVGNCAQLRDHDLADRLDFPADRAWVISLSSTAVVLKLLKDRNELDSPVGGDVLLILLAQDMAVVPMLIVLGLLGGAPPDKGTLMLQVVGAILIIGSGGWLAARGSIRIPFLSKLRQDHELQVFAALLACFGLAFLTGMLQL